MCHRIHFYKYRTDADLCLDCVDVTSIRIVVDTETHCFVHGRNLILAILIRCFKCDLSKIPYALFASLGITRIKKNCSKLSTSSPFLVDK